MDQGAAAHAAGNLVAALVHFEAALALAPDNTNAASACAALLFEQSRPRAALSRLCQVENQLLAEAEGACNLGIAALSCAQPAQARGYFEHALRLDESHVRTLIHLGTLAAREGRWSDAIAHATHCLRLLPQSETSWTNLADFLMGGRQSEEALAHLDEALGRFPGHPELALRHAVAQALSGNFDAAEHEMASLDAQAQGALRLLLKKSTPFSPGDAEADTTPRSLFCLQAFEAMDDCDWRDRHKLTAALREILADVRQPGKGRDSRHTMLYGLTLPLPDEDLLLASQATWAALAAPAPAPAKPLIPFSIKQPLQRDDRIHVGIAARSLRDAAATSALAAQLALHDHSRFAFHIYSPTPQPQAMLAEPLHPHHVVEIAHFTDEETVGRIRLDRLDLLVDNCFGTPWWRPGVLHRRVAAVQLEQYALQPYPVNAPFDYLVSDTFVSPHAPQPPASGAALVRLPHAAWFLPDSPQPERACIRAEAGLPEDALVLYSRARPFAINPQSFSAWMDILNAVPDAVLWLPDAGQAAAQNLAREAAAAGINPERLILTSSAAQDALRLQHADLFVDTLHLSTFKGLSDALMAGIPAISSAGSSMASRMGASRLSAAGLPECIVESRQAYVAETVRLGRDRGSLSALRQRLHAAKSDAAFFDLNARIRELEAAWTSMAQRTRDKQPPAGFDVVPHPSIRFSTGNQ
ncbi:MAG: tetratricopeptide repeat protein [Polaromonas sp.]|uniref:O-linked N-acetylglucosamine transferase family protein n=1 Tax=Polaromonas sp. TaxID=1869339 RepID=UPI003265971B